MRGPRLGIRWSQLSPRTLLTLPNPTPSEIIVIPSGLLSQLLLTLNGYGVDGQVERKL